MLDTRDKTRSKRDQDGWVFPKSHFCDSRSLFQRRVHIGRMIQVRFNSSVSEVSRQQLWDFQLCRLKIFTKASLDRFASSWNSVNLFSNSSFCCAISSRACCSFMSLSLSIYQYKHKFREKGKVYLLFRDHSTSRLNRWKKRQAGMLAKHHTNKKCAWLSGNESVPLLSFSLG